MVQNYLKSVQCQIEQDSSNLLMKQLDEKIKQFHEDQQEYMTLKNMKNVNVLINPLPRCWKCLTWKNNDDVFMKTASGRLIYIFFRS